ncbi:hypothetical protein [Streptomyces sp. NRRL S-646]|uniref:hypothetical protein n=1 Tax=Streptomyces sp. NRRL S-646 TaxID=1463917 RepID=UPI0004C5CF85|nr:hypothetical protein [Streptomyces sp. NRRL S-646]
MEIKKVVVREEEKTTRQPRIVEKRPLATFDILQEPTPLAELSDRQLQAAKLLADEGLALLADGRAVALPPRLRSWPVPCTGI